MIEYYQVGRKLYLRPTYEKENMFDKFSHECQLSITST